MGCTDKSKNCEKFIISHHSSQFRLGNVHRLERMFRSYVDACPKTDFDTSVYLSVNSCQWDDSHNKTDLPMNSLLILPWDDGPLSTPKYLVFMRFWVYHNHRDALRKVLIQQSETYAPSLGCLTFVALSNYFRYLKVSHACSLDLGAQGKSNLNQDSRTLS